jgi:GxxExxY protein
MIQEQLSGKIIGAGMDVLNELRPGLDEKLYERAMIIELKRRGHTLSIQRAFPVFYRGELIGNLIPDLIVDERVIVDPKVVACFTDTHVAQMLGYLNITGLDRPCCLILRTRAWNGNVYCAREKLANTTYLIFMPESYPCHPCNPWFLEAFGRIVASLARKVNAK